MGRHGENIRRRKDGRWEARYLLGHAPDGRARYRYLYGKTYQEVKNKRQQVMAQQAPALPIETKTCTVRQLATEWLCSCKGQIKESTYAVYMGSLERHIFPELGELPLANLTTERLEQFLADKYQMGRLDGTGGLSGKSVADLRAILMLILAYGQRRGYLGLQTIRPHMTAKQAKNIQILSRYDQMRLEQVLLRTPEPIHLGILLSLYAGLRIGEVCALQWGDFDFLEGTLHVQKTLLRIQDTRPDSATKTRLLIERPKTVSSDRIIPLSDFLLALLKPEERDADSYLLTGTSRFIEPRSYLNQYKRILKHAGIESYTYHALRHTFATRCVEQGVDIKSLSEIMGHSNVTVTMQRYVHPSMSLKREQMNKLAGTAICGQTSGQQS